MTADNVLFEIKGLKKNFGNLEVLKGIHTTIRKGEVVVVIGPSGSGKSTFIRCLNLLETPTEGQIFFEGSCITDKGYAVHKHREKVGMVFQQFNLFNNLTILENVTISLKKVKKVPAPAAEEKARALLRRVGLEDNVFMKKGEYATNAQLVERAVKLGILAGREIATAAEAREILGIKPEKGVLYQP